ncbi:pilus (MSHA type) biogenesis protein MshL [Sulfurospirillum deleyianum]|uniref:Pilus (MSHA type) biogenesis protein MshL n=1 Tax=Sulfurospirillum deleyianum (strain ATCC 51133 / DSM 6946 / 5175) TaxID=525898 RepID=D1B1U1_SULD5|nr:pilus (MSHA type) biogenesis protein MshL [Sulfurospirillum deleyianum]ACZ12061.1 pilus (MSHA type) biogenesis protein MshL [Sulfurospirillum deleyianum DSM 6946]
MSAISKFSLNKYLSAVALVTVALLPLQAAEKNKNACEYRSFNIKTNNKATGAELLSELADVCDFSIAVKDTEAERILAKNLHGINIKNLSLDEVFHSVISDNDLFYTYDKNFLKISALSTKSFKVDYISSAREGKAVMNASVDATPTEDGEEKDKTTQSQNSISSNESFDFWKTISAELLAIVNTGAEGYKAQAPIINANAGIITVTGTKKQLDRVSEYIELLKERLHKQVLIDVSIISVALDSSNKTGIDWSKFQLGFNSTSMFNNNNDNANMYHTSPYSEVGLSGTPILNNLTVVNDAVFSVSGLIDFLGSSGDAKVVSSPKVLTMNNQQALITVGDNINYRIPEETDAATTSGTATLSVTYMNYSIFIGVLLNITPEISEDNEIILRINPSVSSFKYTDDDQKTTEPREIAPDTQEKKLSTVVKVKDGSTIILGGLIASEKGHENSSVPLLSSIPLLGEAFKHSEETLKTKELVFVITPRIIGAKGTDKATLKDLGFSQKIYE